jgi:hypothetical protein
VQKVIDSGETIELYENDIDLYLHQFQEEQGIEDLRTVPQSVWNAALMYVQRHVLNDKSKLKQGSNIHNSNSIMDSNYNMYDYDIIYNILEYYIYICNQYNKEVSIMGFSKLTKIDTDTINSWGNNENKLSSKSSVIYKKLTQEREESLANKLADGKQNPVGVIAMLNRHYGWASPYTSDSNRQKQSLTAAELPQLGQNSPVLIDKKAD